MSQPDPTTAQVSAVVDAHVREIVATAERAAHALQQEVEAEAARRAAETRADAEADAEAIRQAAEQQAIAHVEDARRLAEAFADGRIQRLHELSDELIARGEAIRSRLPEVETLRSSLDDLVAALTAAAHLAAAEASRPAVRIPAIDRDAAPAPAAFGPAAPDTASEQVREAARDLPRVPRRPGPAPHPEDRRA